MTKETDSNHNNLNINALPTPIGRGDDSGYPEVPVNSYIIRLVSQLLDMADADYTLLSPNDKATCANNIKRVYHLVRLNKHQLHNLKGVRHYDVIRISRCLDAVGLHLDTPVRWVEEVQEYYIKNSMTKK